MPYYIKLYTSEESTIRVEKFTGIDLYFGIGATITDIRIALQLHAGLNPLAIALYDEDGYLDTMQYDRWAWIYDVDCDSFPLKASVEVKGNMDFDALVRSIQRTLNIDIAIPDEHGPLPDDMVAYSKNGETKKFSLP